MVWHIERLCLGGLVLWMFGSFWCIEGFVLGLALHLDFGKGISAVHLYFCQFVEVASGVFHPNPLLHFLQMGQFGPHLHCSGFGIVELGFDWSWSWGSTFITGSLRYAVCGSVGGRGNWPILP